MFYIHFFKLYILKIIIMEVYVNSMLLNVVLCKDCNNKAIYYYIIENFYSNFDNYT